jgi:hypothetical protein
MHSANLAQWLLARVSTPEHSSSIVGDLLEEHMSPPRFWLSIIRVMFALTRRWILAIGFSAASFFVVQFPYSLIVQPRRDLAHPQPWIHWATYLVAGAACIGTSTAIAASLYGMRDGLTRICAATWALIIASALCAWLPYAPWIIVSLLTVTCAALLAATRGLMLCALMSAAAYALTYEGLFLLLERVVQGINPQTVAGVALETTLGISTWLASIFTAAFVLTRLRRIFLRQPASESEGAIGFPG